MSTMLGREIRNLSFDTGTFHKVQTGWSFVINAPLGLSVERVLSIRMIADGLCKCVTIIILLR